MGGLAVAGKAVWAFLTRVPLWIYAAIAAGLLVMFLINSYGDARYVEGQTNVQTKWDKAVAAAKLKADKEVSKQAAITGKVETKTVTLIRTIRERGKTITREVPVYVSSSDCPMSGGFRVLHDAAAEGTLPDPADIPDAAPVAAQAVAATVSDNYTACHENAATLSGLQEWVREQKKLSDG